MLISEVILENFMSYEYARVPLKPGINVVCGPNGAGKSSLLLAISVALGQSYTERSRKLSDLIRWGKDQARVTLILDNSKRGGKRPVPKFNKDQIFLTRVLRRDGKYWFELENRAASKQDVERLLARLGVDPDNMLIIMHQNMVEQFTVLSPQDKLKMVEAAVGLEAYRENVLEAQKKLTRILSQEESISKLLESAEQTLNYWREQYERFQEKRQLMAKRHFLERELAWAEVNRRENIVKDLEAKRGRELALLRQIEEEAKTAQEQLQNQQSQLERLKSEWKRNLNETISLEREKAGSQATISLCEQLLAEASLIENQAQGGRHLKLLKTESLKELQSLMRS
jgi:chromosome segregation ATPase